MRFTTIDSKLVHNCGTVSKWFSSPSIRYPSFDIMVLNIKRMLYNVLRISLSRREHFFGDFKWKKYLRAVSTFLDRILWRSYEYWLERTVSLRKLNSIVVDNRFEFWCFLKKNCPKKHICSRKLVGRHAKIHKEILFRRIWKDSVKCVCMCIKGVPAIARYGKQIDFPSINRRILIYFQYQYSRKIWIYFN